MLRMILISILLTVVYSWDEFRRSVWVLLYGLFRKKHPLKYYSYKSDKLVGTLVMLATVPVGLTYILFGSGNTWNKLAWIGSGLLLISLLAAGSAVLVRRLRYLGAYEGVERIIPITFSVAGLLAPIFRLFTDFTTLPRKVLVKMTFFLSLPSFLGLSLERLNRNAVPAELLPNMNLLLEVLVAALFVRITVEFLEQYFRLYRLNRLFSYFRVVLGIVLASVLLMH